MASSMPGSTSMIILQGLLTSKASSRGRSHPALKGLQPISGTGVVIATAAI
jgi:hypothetical protein